MALFPGEEAIPPAAAPTPSRGVCFQRPDPRELFVCGVRLDPDLTDMGQRAALDLREWLQAQDWGPFEARYNRGSLPVCAGGEAGVDSVLGFFKVVSSLRGLEALARLDRGCLWMTGGLCPDHASLGRFIQLHEASRTGDFVIALTRTVLQVTGTGVAPVAGDGTVVQAAASNSRTLKLEAAREAAVKAREAAQDATLAARATRAEAAQATLEQRTAARRAKGKSADNLK